MGVGGADNPFWLDVLEWGPDSAYAGWFDIDWRPDRPYLHDKLLVPFLGDQFGAELEAGKLMLKFDAEDGQLRGLGLRHPQAAGRAAHYGEILGTAPAELERLGDAFADLRIWRPHERAARRRR